MRQVDRIVEQAHGVVDRLPEALPVDRSSFIKRGFDESREIDRPEVASSPGWQRNLAARVGRADLLFPGKVVLTVDLINEKHTRLGSVIGRLRDFFPQLARPNGAHDTAGNNTLLPWPA